jgi:hypothetical protein
MYVNESFIFGCYISHLGTNFHSLVHFYISAEQSAALSHRVQFPQARQQQVSILRILSFGQNIFGQFLCEKFYTTRGSKLGPGRACQMWAWGRAEALHCRLWLLRAWPGGQDRSGTSRNVSSFYCGQKEAVKPIFKILVFPVLKFCP